MLDTQWFMRQMHGDELVVRLHVDTAHPPVVKVEAHAFSYWNDDMAYNGSEVIYHHGAGERDYDLGTKPLEWKWLPSDCNKWPALWQEAAAKWPRHWDVSERVVCTIGRTPKSANRIPVTHPLALTHLARFQAASALTRPATNALTGPMEGRGWDITAGIIARRLDGIIKAGVRDWERLIGA